MGGIVTPPLKLLDSVSFGVDGQWVGKATQFTSGAGYVRYDLPPHRRGSTWSAPTSRRTACAARCSGSSCATRATGRDRADPGRRALRADGPVPVGLRRRRAEGERQRARHRRLRGRHGSCSATPGSSRARRLRTPTPRSSAPIAQPVTRRGRPGPLRPERHGPHVRPHPGPDAGADAEGVRRRPVRQGHRRPAHLRAQVPSGGSRTLWIARGRARTTRRPTRAPRSRELTRDPAARAAREAAHAQAARALDAALAARRPAAAGLDRVGQAEPRRPHAGGDRPRPPLDEPGQGVDPRRLAGADALGRRGLPGLPVAVRRRRRVHRAREGRRSASSRRSRTTCARCATCPTSSATARASSSTRWSPTARSGSATTAANESGRHDHVRLQHGRDRQVPGRGRAGLALDGDDRFRDEMLDFMRPRPRLRAPRSSTTTATAGPRATATWSATGMGAGEARQRRLLHPRRSTTTPTWRGPRA